MKILTRVWFGLFIIINLSSQVSASTFNTNLSIGSRGDEVKNIQQFLIDKGYLFGVATNYFGPQTKKAVQAFQKQNGLPTTGGWFFLTRKKAEYIIANDKYSTSTKMVATSTTPVIGVSRDNGSNFTIKNKEVTLTISNTPGGSVFSPENNIACYSNENCNKIFSTTKKVTLKASPSPGYSFVGWSEANCASLLECTVAVIENTTVYARFEITKKFQPTASIKSLTHPRDTCNILLGEDKCNVRLTWISNVGLDMTIKNDEDEYYLALKDNNVSGWLTSDLDPEDAAKAKSENVLGPVYMSMFQGPHKISLKSQGQILDTVGVDVGCMPGSFWDGTKCWEKDAKRLYVFKTFGASIKSSPSRINCGYNPEICTAGFSSSSKVILTATVIPGYTFNGWYGDCSGKEPTCTILMDKEKSVGFYVSGSPIQARNSTTSNTQTIGSPVPGCVPNWQCNGWGMCSNLKLTRSCFDINNCNSSIDKPTTQVSCAVQNGTLNNGPKMVP